MEWVSILLNSSIYCYQHYMLVLPKSKWSSQLFHQLVVKVKKRPSKFPGHSCQCLVVMVLKSNYLLMKNNKINLSFGSKLQVYQSSHVFQGSSITCTPLCPIGIIIWSDSEYTYLTSQIWPGHLQRTKTPVFSVIYFTFWKDWWIQKILYNDHLGLYLFCFTAY